MAFLAFLLALAGVDLAFAIIIYLVLRAARPTIREITGLK